jgi:hypothetical protein
VDSFIAAATNKRFTYAELTAERNQRFLRSWTAARIRSGLRTKGAPTKKAKKEKAESKKATERAVSKGDIPPVEH